MFYYMKAFGRCGKCTEIQPFVRAGACRFPNAFGVIWFFLFEYEPYVLDTQRIACTQYRGRVVRIVDILQDDDYILLTIVCDFSDAIGTFLDH